MRPLDDLTHQIDSFAATLDSHCDSHRAARTVLMRHGHVDIRELPDLWTLLSPHLADTDRQIVDRIRVAIFTTAPGQVLDAPLGDHIHLRMTGVSHASPLPNTLARADFTSLTRPPTTLVSRQLTWERLESTALDLQAEYRSARREALEALAAEGDLIDRLKRELAAATERRQSLVKQADQLRVPPSEIAELGLMSRQGVYHVLRSTEL